MLTQPPVAERLRHLRRLRQEWTATLYALSQADTDGDVRDAYDDALTDLNTLIRQIEHNQADHAGPSDCA